MKKKILAIDDEFSITSLLNHLLKDTYDIVIQENGLQGLHWLEEGNMPDLIIVDIEMPEMNGYEFLENIKSSIFYKDIPILMLSANETSSDRIKALKKGADDYLVKPFNPEELELRITNLILRFA